MVRYQRVVLRRRSQVLASLKRELDRNTDCKAIIESYRKEKESIGTAEETVLGSDHFV
jgi:hypothetical protein